MILSRKIYEEFVSANIIGVTLEHNGFQGGDSGHGGFVRIVIKNLACTAMEVNNIPCEEGEQVELKFMGDCERETLIDALKMIVKDLEAHPYIDNLNKLG